MTGFTQTCACGRSWGVMAGSPPIFGPDGKDICSHCITGRPICWLHLKVDCPDMIKSGHPCKRRRKWEPRPVSFMKQLERVYPNSWDKKFQDSWKNRPPIRTRKLRLRNKLDKAGIWSA